MSLICDAVIGSTTRRIATWELNDRQYPYFAEIESLSNFNMSHSKRHGGYLKPSYGSITILQSAFENNWPPPATITLPLQIITDSGDIDIATGSGQVENLGETTVEYEVYGPEYEATTTAATDTSNDTLVDYFTWACDSARLNLTLDSSNASDCDITFPAQPETLIIDILDRLAYDCNHAFKIEEGTLYLIDLANSTGSQTIDAGFDLISVSYAAPTPYSLFKSGNYTVAGSYPNSDREYSISHLFHTAQTDIEAQLARTKTLLDKWWITISMPIGGTQIAYGEKLTFTDTDKLYDIDVEMYAREFKYQLSAGEEILTIEGEGTIS